MPRKTTASVPEGKPAPRKTGRPPGNTLAKLMDDPEKRGAVLQNVAAGKSLSKALEATGVSRATAWRLSKTLGFQTFMAPDFEAVGITPLKVAQVLAAALEATNTAYIPVKSSQYVEGKQVFITEIEERTQPDWRARLAATSQIADLTGIRPDAHAKLGAPQGDGGPGLTKADVSLVGEALMDSMIARAQEIRSGGAALPPPGAVQAPQTSEEEQNNGERPAG